MDTTISISPEDSPESESSSDTFKKYTGTTLFTAASEGDVAALDGLLDFLQKTGKTLTDEEFVEKNGKTVLMIALLNLKDGKNDTVEKLIDIAEKHAELTAEKTREKNDNFNKFINAAYTGDAKGHTALHVAIERRSLKYVKLLVEKGANVKASASGKFFQFKSKGSFYFGELPLSLAASSNQLDIVLYLLDKADVKAQDSLGNTVLHVLVIAADKEKDLTKNTKNLVEMYDNILTHHYKNEKSKKLKESEKTQPDQLDCVENPDCRTPLMADGHPEVIECEKSKQKQKDLESIENYEGLTPLKLAAKLGRIGMLKHMMNREFSDEELKPLSRKFKEWVYGPVCSSVYDMSSIDTIESNSVLAIILFRCKSKNRPEMLQTEPLCSLLQTKWEKYAFILFWVNFGLYLIYLIIFTTVSFYRKDGQPPFPIENSSADYLRFAGQIITVLGAICFICKSTLNLRRHSSNFKGLFMNGNMYFLSLLQSALLLLAVVLYFCGMNEYVGFLVISLALAWVNTLYYTRGAKQLGIYNVMMQRMILSDLLHFLCIYIVLLLGFSVAVVTLMDDRLVGSNNTTNTTLDEFSAAEAPKCWKPSYSEFQYTLMEMFKFTIGMGNLEFTNDAEYKEVFYILLIWYVVLTYILMLNMLIAIMGNTVQTTTGQSKNIWYLQRAFAILDIETCLPKWLRNKLLLTVLRPKRKGENGDEKNPPRWFRVYERNWENWRLDVCSQVKEDHTLQKVKKRSWITFKKRKIKLDHPDRIDANKVQNTKNVHDD